MWKIKFTKQSRKDAKKILASGLQPKVEKLLKLMEKNPYTSPPSFEKLIGDLKNDYSRRINIIHRLIYQINDKEKIIKIIRMWTHYE